MTKKTKNNNQVEAVQPAKIEWQEKTAVSLLYDDIYFSTDSGAEETNYVFLKQNNLPDAWEAKTSFTILETGFGTGLNFFCVLDAWFNSAQEASVLRFVSVEKHPLAGPDFLQLCSIWPQYKSYIEEIHRQYPPMVTGFHHLNLFQGRVKLLLLFGDATEQFSQLQCSADACFLDGFAPSKNQSMWSADLFAQIARLMKTGATISTFTAVGDVRRGLQQAGFDMQKADAFGEKRHMLIGRFNASEKNSALKSELKPWYTRPDFSSTGKKVTVIGAGIAGLSTAVALQQSGWQVTVLEQSDAVASGASGNLAGVVMPRPDQEQTADAMFYWQAFNTALNYLHEFQREGIETGLQPSGVLQLVDSVLESSVWPDEFFTMLSKQQAQDKSGIAVNKAAIHLSSAAFICPELLCRSLYEKHKNQICFKFNTQVQNIEKASQGWQLSTVQSIEHADAVVICNAEAATQFEQTRFLSLQAVRGQITSLEQASLKQTSLARRLKSVICDRGYLIPAGDNLVFGASFKRDDNSRDLRLDEHIENIQRVNGGLEPADQLKVTDLESLQGRASVRAMASDRMPVVGAVPDVAFYQSHYDDLSKGKRVNSYPMAEYQTGLFINTGHGSRGFTSAFLSAEIICGLVTDDCSPVSGHVLERLHPARFIIRQLLRNKT